jgi:uncharacterized protein (DUF433 family)
MEIAPHINVDPAIGGGTSVITGTRIPVSIVVGSLLGGMTMQEVMAEYVLTKEQIEGALSYTASPPKTDRQAGTIKGMFTMASTRWPDRAIRQRSRIHRPCLRSRRLAKHGEIHPILQQLWG